MASTFQTRTYPLFGPISKYSASAVPSPTQHSFDKAISPIQKALQAWKPPRARNAFFNVTIADCSSDCGFGDRTKDDKISDSESNKTLPLLALQSSTSAFRDFDDNTCWPAALSSRDNEMTRHLQRPAVLSHANSMADTPHQAPSSGWRRGLVSRGAPLERVAGNEGPVPHRGLDHSSLITGKLYHQGPALHVSRRLVRRRYPDPVCGL